MSLINDFLDISKIEANREELFLERVAVEDVCLSALSICLSACLFVCLSVCLGYLAFRV